MHSISSKLATLAAALTMNGIIIGGIAYLFGTQLQQPPAMVAQASLQSHSAMLA